MCLAAVPLAAAEFHFDAKSKDAELRNGAQTADNVFQIIRKRSYVALHGTEKLDLAHGGTMMAECRFSDLGDSPKRFRFLFNKNAAFLFGLTNGKYNFSLCNNGRWSIALIGGEPPPNNQWVHLAAVARRIEEKEQGRVGFLLEVYVNGEKILNKFAPCTELHTNIKSAVHLGTASKDTAFTGQIAQADFFDRALSPAEIMEYAKKCRLTKITLPGQFEVPQEIRRRCATLEKKVSGSMYAGFAARSLHRAALTGVPADKVLRGLAAAENLASAGDKFSEKFNAVQKDFCMIPSKTGILFAVYGDCGKAFPVIDLLDVKTGCSVFGERANGFRIQLKDKSGKGVGCTDFADGIRVTSSITQQGGHTSLVCRWVLDGRFQAVSKGTWGDDGLRMTLDVTPEYGVSLESVTFPQWSFARKQGKDYLVTPFMSGLLVPNPIETYSYERDYPCAQINMLFQAYYSEKGDGVYAALEDPDAVSHGIGVYGKGNQLRTAWRTLVPQGSRFRLSGEAVVRLFQGDWYNAAMLYREFVSAKARWWIPAVPRTSTPEWLRNNSIWILAGVFPSRNTETMLYLRDYFEQEFGVHYIATAKRAWPHFDRTTAHALKCVKRLQNAGLKVIPYADPRLWREAVKADGSIGSDPVWEPGSVEMAVLKENGKPVTEKYGKYSCLVLCPASPVWHKTYIAICMNLAKKGFNGIYHDQLPCAHFEPCYSKDHGHKVADPSAWVTNGYAPFYKTLRETIGKMNPELFHTGEDGSEPFLQLIDGFTAWRWVEPNQIPLFQTIYSGRIQFTGKLYNHQYPGDWESNFAKAGSQFINAEQLGWITLEDLEIATPFRRYFKTLAWYRRALLEYFNAGQRMAPLKFTKDPGLMRSTWGNTSGYGQVVDTPKVMHAVYRLADGRVMAVFVNTTDTEQRAVAVWPYGTKNLRICRPDREKSVVEESVPEIVLDPYSGEVWLQSASDNKAEADDIAAIWHRTRGFEEGKNLHWRNYVQQKVPAELPLEAGKLQSVLLAAEVRESAKRYFANGTDKDPVFHLGNNALLLYKNLVPTSDTAPKRIALVVAWTPEEEGGIFELRSGGRTIGRAVPGKGGRYLSFREVPVELSEPIAKGSNLEVHFSGRSCRIKGFKVLAN